MSDKPIGWNDRVIKDVIDELARAVKKFPTWPTDPLHAVAVLGEEYGELVKAMLQNTYEPHLTSKLEIRKEALQTAAMALRLAASLDVYVYEASRQHAQDQWEEARKRYYEGGGFHPCYD